MYTQQTIHWPSGTMGFNFGSLSKPPYASGHVQHKGSSLSPSPQPYRYHSTAMVPNSREGLPSTPWLRAAIGTQRATPNGNSSSRSSERPHSPAWHGSLGHPSAGVRLDVCLSLALLPLRWCQGEVGPVASQRSVTGPARTNNKDKWAHHSKWLLMGCRRQLVGVLAGHHMWILH